MRATLATAQWVAGRRNRLRRHKWDGQRIACLSGLSGKPDYLLEDEDGEGLVPVEVKSSAAPRRSRPYPSHLMQLAVYFLLVEEVLEQTAPYGLLRYRDRTIRVENTEELREQLLDVVAEMQDILRDGEAYRSHNLARRCAGCSVAYACEERLD